MKAVISSTYDDKYFFLLPISVWCWNKLNVPSIVYVPYLNEEIRPKFEAVFNAICNSNSIVVWRHFMAPAHKEATYAQCIRLYGSAEVVNPKEVLVTSDADMCVFKLPPMDDGTFNIWGSDLVPPKQFPMCYISATVELWDAHLTKGRTAQKCVDDILGNIECEGFKGNHWARDQEEIYNSLNYAPVSQWPRARHGTQFAEHRLDRDDAYLLDRLSPDIVDFHMNRPGYEESNFNIILIVLKYFYPDEDFQWLTDYRNEYINLL